MPHRAPRAALAALLLSAPILLPAASAPGAPFGRRALAQVAPSGVPDGATAPAADALPAPYVAYREALYETDLAALAEIARGDGWLAWRAASSLARHPEAPLSMRLDAFERSFELRLDDPLAREQHRAELLEYARTAEIAGARDTALQAYREALPHPDAREAVARLEPDPYRLANLYLQARLYRDALEALDGRTAPSIEAPAHRRLGRHEAALDAYRRWLDEVPGSPEARSGEAWSLWYLGRLDEAEAAFAALGADGLYGLALIANRRGDVDEAVRLLRATGDPDRLWLATSLLERDDRYAEAVDVYLELAAGASAYADDAAYRALVLSVRLGDDAAGERARALLREGGFFALKTGRALDVPAASALPAEPPAAAREALALADALEAAGEREAAIGELAFALRSAPDEATVVALAERLQALGEYRWSQRAAAALVAQGSDDARTWRLAWPRAYPDAVLPAAEANDLDPALVWAVMRQESAFYPRATSVSDARGLMQVIPSTWDWLAELQGEPPGDPYDVHANVRYGAFYLRWLLDYLGGDEELVVASYNRGQGYIRRLFEGPVVDGSKDELYREIDAFETREYLQRVMVNAAVYRALYDAP